MKLKKYHLKRNIKVFIKRVFIILIVIFLLKNKFINKKINEKADKYVLNSFIASKELNKTSNNNYDAVFKANDIKPNNNYVLYLYNTHQGENYGKKDSILYNANIMTATSYLSEKMNDNEIVTLHEKRSISEVLNNNNWKYSNSYKASRVYLEDIILTYPTLKYFIDIHRDSGSYKNTTLCTNDNCYAKVLFVIGLENENHQENYNFALRLNDKLNNKVSGISKGIIGKEGKGVNGVYNQDFSSRTLLIEIGGENNTIDEVYKTMDILSEVLTDYMKEDI